MAKRAHWLIFVCLAVFFIGATAVWLALDRTPASWDDAYYLNNSLILYDNFAAGGIASLVWQFLHAMKTKPPLIAALPVFAYGIAGRRIHAAYAVNLFFMLVLFGALFRLGKKYGGSRVGLLAVFIAGTMPMLYALSHWFLVECGLTALVCVVIGIVSGFDERVRWPDSALLGVMFGLGLLMKMSFPFYVAVPIIYFVLRNRTAVLKTKPLTAFAAAVAVVAMPWYLINFATALRTALNAGTASTAKIYDTGDILAWRDIWRYLVNLANTGPTLYILMLFVLGAFFAVRLPPAGKKGMLLCALWASPVLFLVPGHYRDLRYAAPLFPAVALGLAILIDFAASGRGIVGWCVACGLLFLPLLSMLQTSFGILGKNKLELGGLLLVEPRFDYARRYDSTTWPQQQILLDMAGRFNVFDRKARPVLLGSDSLRFNADNFQLAATRARLPFAFASTAYESDAGALTSALRSTSYFIYKDGGEADAFQSLAGAAIREVRESGEFRELPIARRLPDGGVAHVLENEAFRGLERGSAFLSADFREIAACNVTFADRIQLTGCSSTRTAGGLVLRFRWKCLKPVDRDYWCFVHMLDRSGKVIGYLDHQILSGNPSTREWKPGDVAFEKMTFLSNESSLQLRLGVFDRSSGGRLPISSSGFALADNGSAAIVSEDAISVKQPPN